MENLDDVFSALGHGTRRAILARLLEGEQPLSELARPFDMSQTAISKHVRILCDAGLASMEQRGRTRYCKLEAAPMQQAVDWLNDYQAFWLTQLDSLARYLSEEER